MKTIKQLRKEIKALDKKLKKLEDPFWAYKKYKEGQKNDKTKIA